MSKTFVAIDLEFTGLDPLHDRIIEIGMVKFRGEEEIERFSSLVNAHRHLPYKVQQLGGITQRELDRAPSLEELRGEILRFVGNYPLVGHNIEVDLGFLQREGLPLQNLYIDTFELATIVLPGARRYSLANLIQHLGLAQARQHRALDDALATKELFLALWERIRRWDDSLLEELAYLAQVSDWPLADIFRQALVERQADKGGTVFASHTSGRGRVLPPPVEEEELPPLKPKEPPEPLDVEELAALISPGGLFARRFPGYEYREQQVEMLRAVAEAFNLPAHLLVEAGTGTGKSLAYLLPAIYFAVRNGQRVVISSNTINLQDQLFGKDIPDIQRILPFSFQAALLKGRGNYLCLRRLEALRRSPRLSTEEARVLAKVLVWLSSTRTGDRAELLLINAENQVWARLGGSSETCLGDLCPYYQSGQCFFFRARARAERAHLVVVNHALLLSDLALESRILPEYRYLVIDEAHHLEEQATNQFGLELGRQGIYAFFSSLYHEREGVPGGLLAELPGLFQRPGVSRLAQHAVLGLTQKVRAQLDTAERRLYELFTQLESFVEAYAQERGNASQAYERHIRLTGGVRTQPIWSTIEVAAENLLVPMRQVLQGIERLLTYLEGLPGENSERDELAQELRARLQQGLAIWEGIEQILLSPEPEGIYWISLSRRTQEITLHSAPLHVGPTLAERLFGEKDCVVLTSATLQAGGDFRFIKERLGIEDALELALDSPFDFQSAVLLYVPRDIPEPNQPFYQKSVERALIDLCRATEGRTLVLFTSNSQLYSTYYAIRSALEREEIVVFAQGIDGSRRQLLESFRHTPRSVLMGTRSFWEGIDVVGEALVCLVIVRLPFSVPTDPVFAARAETFEDPFNEFYLPEAILRFRQGFGRLIRSRDDYGLVVVLDKRLLTKSYGKAILRSLPPCTARQGPLASLPNLARRWLDPALRKSER